MFASSAKISHLALKRPVCPTEALVKLFLWLCLAARIWLRLEKYYDLAEWNNKKFALHQKP